jgi:hypothetical protein
VTPEAAPEATANEQATAAFSEAAMWPWQMMQQMREQMQQSAEAAVHAATAEEGPADKPSRRSKK